MSEPEWKGNVLLSRNNVLVLLSRNNVLGWVGHDLSSQFWYARTASHSDNPPIRGEFDNEQSARDFLQFITSVENTNGPA